jgi:formylglycine-generating enzyme required for sulfatase activity
MMARGNRSRPKARLVAVGLTTFACAFVALVNTNPGDVKTGSALAATTDARFVHAAGSGTDAKTGLPKRVVHRASGIVLVLVPAGEFQMGSPVDEPDREANERQHRRVVRQPFYIGETEVTLDQFRRFVRATNYLTDAERGTEEGGHTRGAFAATPDGDREWNASASWRNPFPHLKDYRARDNHPVVHVSWNDARRFVEHHGLRLPTEAEWEYAARAGTRTRFFWGDAESGGHGHGNLKDATGRRRFEKWNSSFAFDDGVLLLSEVGRYRANAWGLRDAAGNVSEWCEDVYRKDYPADGADESAAEGERAAPRVIRGSSWLDGPDFSRPAKRVGFLPQGRRDFIGFRVAAAPESVK